MIQLTERILNDAGGWQAMKVARGIAAAGRVSEATWDEPWLRGRVREGETEFRAGLKVLSKSNIENLCTCRLSRQQGAICPHSLAVGLAHLKPAPAAVKKPAPAEPAGSRGGPLRSKSGVVFNVGESQADRLVIVIPPNVEKAFARGGVTTGVEIAGGPRPVLISGLPASSAQVSSARDVALLEYVLRLTDGVLPGMMSLNRTQFLGLLTAASGHGGLSIGRARRAEIRTVPARIKLEARELPSGDLRLTLELPDGAGVLTDGASAWLFRDDFIFEPIAPDLPPAYASIFGGEVVIPPGGVSAFLAREALMLAQHFDFTPPGGLAVLSPVPVVAAMTESKFILKLEGSLNHLGARLEADGGYALTVRGASPRSPAERAALARLSASGFAGPNTQNEWALKGEPNILRFFASELPALERDWTVTIGSRFTNISQGLDRLEPRFEVRGSGANWFELSVELVSQSGERFSAGELRRLLNSGQSSVRLRNQRRLALSPNMIEDFEHVLRDCNPQQTQPGTYRFDRRDGDYLAAFARESGAALIDPQSATRTLERKAKTEIDFGTLETVLRDYQKLGTRWMNQLAENGLGGILADEMGLGKTVQALAWLRHLPGQCLVICPSTLVWNWRREADRFTPELAALNLEGADRREQFQALDKHRLIVTSYALLRRDLEFYRKRRFTAVVLDEAQHIKNPDSQVAQAAFALNADHRLALSGTPIENSVREIWSTMNFLMPGYLGSRREFKERFESPIAAQPGGPEHQRLVRRLRPFILRRTKKEVVKELPDKIEQVLDVELTEAQKSAYAAFARGAQEMVADLLRKKNGGMGASRMAALTALLRLRQICLDLRLLGESQETSSAEESGKLNLLGELISEAVADEHRVLVFSQFAGMLRLIREMLERDGVGFAYLDGSTRDRQREVDRFQTGTVPVFLISLKAGGVGLNLTAADTVIHFDPWWNPAVEAQATDRAHRIGQTKVVNVYKLIARDTVEEKILALQRKKRGLAADILESDEPAMQGLSDGDLWELLE